LIYLSSIDMKRVLWRGAIALCEKSLTNATNA